ncbi:hypothetical protein LZ30DRAFT_66081 [Colletotrichum cereale]|nr:hypothetical protein LZ30DRAFT_66081 [Colletotrichum cereale]
MAQMQKKPRQAFCIRFADEKTAAQFWSELLPHNPISYPDGRQASNTKPSKGTVRRGTMHPASETRLLTAPNRPVCPPALLIVVVVVVLLGVKGYKSHRLSLASLRPARATHCRAYAVVCPLQRVPSCIVEEPRRQAGWDVPMSFVPFSTTGGAGASTANIHPLSVPC